LALSRVKAGVAENISISCTTHSKELGHSNHRLYGFVRKDRWSSVFSATGNGLRVSILGNSCVPIDIRNGESSERSPWFQPSVLVDGGLSVCQSD
jgi:hypothetical protein